MDHSQLKATALAVFGFVPEWTPGTCAKICKRIKELDVLPAAFLRAVVENMKERGSKLRYEGVILSRKFEQFIPDQLKLMEQQAKVRMESDMVEFRAALKVSSGDYRVVLEDDRVDISCLGRDYIAKMYGLEDAVQKFEKQATLDLLANPFLDQLYRNLQEDAK